MRAEAEAQALRQKQEFEARNPKKQAGIWNPKTPPNSEK